MLNRRSLLTAAAGLMLNQMLAGCRLGSRNAALRVRLLEGSIPTQILREFQRRLLQKDTAFTASQQIADLFQQLQTWQYPTANSPRFNLPLPGANSTQNQPIADLVTLGDYWLTAAIQQNLIQPLPVETFAGWQQLPADWQALFRRDRQGQLSASGEFWGAPYRWGSLVMVYHQESFQRLGWQPTDWQDLWRPELKGRLSLLDSPRSTIGLVLKKLGQSVNTVNPTTVANLEPELQALHQQVKFYSSETYLQPLTLEDTWIAVGWSTEVLPMIEREPRLAAVVPASGTILTADVWVRPASIRTAPSDRLQQWIEFCWQPAIATQLSLLGEVASPILVTLDRSQLPSAIQQNSVLLPPAEVIANSEFLQPLPSSEAYSRLWEKLRQTG